MTKTRRRPTARWRLLTALLTVFALMFGVGAGAAQASVPAYSRPSDYNIYPAATWYVYNATTAHMESFNIPFGIEEGKKWVQLGTVAFAASWVGGATNNQRFSTSMTFSSTTAIKYLGIVEAMGNGGAGVRSGGKLIHECEHDAKNLKANALYHDTVIGSGGAVTGGCAYTDKTAGDHNYVTVIQWQDAAFPVAYWYCTFASPVMHTNTTGGKFTYYLASWLAGRNGLPTVQEHFECGYNGDRTDPWY